MPIIDVMYSALPPTNKSLPLHILAYGFLNAFILRLYYKDTQT